MIYKYTIVFFGKSLHPELIKDKVQGGFIMVSSFGPNDVKNNESQEKYGFGSLLYFHPYNAARGEDLEVYEDDCVSFIERNYQLFKENGLESIDVFMEIFYDGGQCNFQIFNKSKLERLVQCGVTFPVSVYVLRDEELQEWESELNHSWGLKA